MDQVGTSIKKSYKPISVKDSDFLRLTSCNFLIIDQIWYIQLEKRYRLSRTFEWYKNHSDWI